jgi:polyhydroxyalkanoate synthesis regulator phasin
MTAEIVIMNKEAIALASDSAVTMSGESGQKIFTSANKLFALSKNHPVGIMIYGSAIFMGVPWETIIKIYRKKLGNKNLETLEDYVNDFIEFLDNGNPMFPDSVQEDYLRNSIYAYFKFIKNTIIKRVHSKIEEKGEITDEEIKQIVSEIIKEHYGKWGKVANIPSIPKSYNKTVIDKFGQIIDKAIKDVFEELPLSKMHSNHLKKIAASLFSKFPEGLEKGDRSGVVIAGFGEINTFPSLEAFLIEGIVNNKLKYKEHISVKINFKTSASLIPFAQREMVDVFMEGLDPSYRIVEESYLAEIFNDYAGIVVDSLEKYIGKEKKQLKEKLVKMGEEILKDHKERLEKHRKEKYVRPVTTVVSMLPKDELAAMAESLVNLTSFKRKVTMESETVGGPIDVAVISKGDGFIWIKRKHYFKAELNTQFFSNYYKVG